MGWSITNIWNLLTYDVEDTVYTVAKAVLDEKDIPKDVRTTRAAAIKAIGTIFKVPSLSRIPFPWPTVHTRLHLSKIVKAASECHSP